MKHVKIYLAALIIMMLIVSIAAPSMAASPWKSSTGVNGQKNSPTTQPSVTPVANGSAPGTGNFSNGYPVSGVGKLKVGNLHTPPNAGYNFSKPTLKGSLNDYRLKAAKKIADVRINIIIKQIELYKKKITNSRLTDEDKATLIAAADANILWYQQKNEEIQAAADMATFQALLAEVDQQTELLRVDLKKGAGLLACDELDAKIVTARQVSDRVAEKIADLKAMGNDTTQLERKLAEYDAHVDSASQHVTEARDAFDSITGATNVEGKFSEGLRHIRLAEVELSKAYADLKDMYRLFFRGRL